MAEEASKPAEKPAVDAIPAKANKSALAILALVILLALIFYFMKG